MKQEIKNQMFWMLQDAITHFGSDPKNNRAVISTSDGKEGKCNYSRVNGNLGCAIGMYLSDKVAEDLDSLDATSIDDIIEYYPECLPKWMLKLDPKFLFDLQNFHDSQFHWNLKNNCISKVGIGKVEYICKEYDLPFKELTFPKTKNKTK